MILRLTRLLMLSLSCTFLASADEVLFSFSTTGSFSLGTPSDLAFLGIGTGSVPGFTGMTAGNTLSLSNLGTFALTKPGRSADDYTGDTFTLDLSFFAPSGIDGLTMFDAQLTGSVNKNLGTLHIDFGPTKNFQFDNDSGSGAFDLSINDLTLTVPKDGTTTVSQVLTGNITNAFDPQTDATPAPEPASIVLLSGAALLVAAKLRFRMRKVEKVL